MIVHALRTPTFTTLARRRAGITVDPAKAHDDALAGGAVRFTRLEGSNFTEGAFWFHDTQGGEVRRGQIYRLIPGPGERPGCGHARARVRVDERERARPARQPDRHAVGRRLARGGRWRRKPIVGISPEGGTYVFARNAHPDMNEFAGPTFSPDGNTFFVNVQDPGRRSRSGGHSHATTALGSA